MSTIDSPNTSTIRSEYPLITLAWSPKSSAELTMPTTLTTRFTRSTLPSAARSFASVIKPACLAAS